MKNYQRSSALLDHSSLQNSTAASILLSGAEPRQAQQHPKEKSSFNFFFSFHSTYKSDIYSACISTMYNCTTLFKYCYRRQHSRTGQWYTKKMLPFWVFLLLPLMMWYGWLVGYYTQPKYHSENTYRAPLSIYICGINMKPLRMGALWMECTHLSQSSIPLSPFKKFAKNFKQK